jgi:hypothetical protein
MRFLLAFAIMLSSAACVSVPQSTALTVEFPSGQELQVVSVSGEYVCAVHHTAIVTRPAFKAPRDVIVDPSEEEYRAMQKLPNFVHAGRSLHRSRDYPRAAPVSYCPKCEEEAVTVWHLPRP